MKHLSELPVVVIGAGPVGLAAAAHLNERDLPFLVLESGPGPGAAVAEWGHVRLFSPWRYNIDPAARRLLDAAGRTAPDHAVLPTGDRTGRAGPPATREAFRPGSAHPLCRPGWSR